MLDRLQLASAVSCVNSESNLFLLGCWLCNSSGCLDLLDFWVVWLIRTALVLCLELSLSNHIVTEVDLFNLIFFSQPSLLPVIQFFIFFVFILKETFEISACQHFQVNLFKQIRLRLFSFEHFVVFLLIPITTFIFYPRAKRSVVSWRVHVFYFFGCSVNYIFTFLPLVHFFNRIFPKIKIILIFF
jgi:hypothetical protein